MKLVKSYTDPMMAELDKSLLESGGIYCNLVDREIVNLNWFYSNVLGGVKLYVNDEDYNDALNVLNIPGCEPPQSGKSEYSGVNKRTLVVWVTIIFNLATIILLYLLYLL